MRGNQIPRNEGSGDGAQGRGQPWPRSLPRPSPSANLVGNWKGDPLGPQVAAPKFSPTAARCLSHPVNPGCIPATPSERLDMKKLIAFTTITLAVWASEIWWSNSCQPNVSTTFALRQFDGSNHSANNLRQFEAAKSVVPFAAGMITF